MLLPLTEYTPSPDFVKLQRPPPFVVFPEPSSDYISELIIVLTHKARFLTRFSDSPGFYLLRYFLLSPCMEIIVIVGGSLALW